MSSDDYDEGLNEAEYQIEDNPELVSISVDEGEFTKVEGKSVDENKPLTEEEKFEREKQKLRDNQRTTYEKEDQKYVEIKIPATGKVGKEFVIKTSKKVPIIEFAVCQKLEWKRKNQYKRHAKKELVGKMFMASTKKDTDKAIFKWEDISMFHGKPFNGLKAGEYLVEVSARSKVAYEETKALRLVRVEE